MLYTSNVADMESTFLINSLLRVMSHISRLFRARFRALFVSFPCPSGCREGETGVAPVGTTLRVRPVRPSGCDVQVGAEAQQRHTLSRGCVPRSRSAARITVRL